MTSREFYGDLSPLRTPPCLDDLTPANLILHDREMDKAVDEMRERQRLEAVFFEAEFFEAQLKKSNSPRLTDGFTTPTKTKDAPSKLLITPKRKSNVQSMVKQIADKQIADKKSSEKQSPNQELVKKEIARKEVNHKPFASKQLVKQQFPRKPVASKDTVSKQQVSRESIASKDTVPKQTISQEYNSKIASLKAANPEKEAAVIAARAIMDKDKTAERYQGTYANYHDFMYGGVGGGRIDRRGRATPGTLEKSPTEMMNDPSFHAGMERHKARLAEMEAQTNADYKARVAFMKEKRKQERAKILEEHEKRGGMKSLAEEGVVISKEDLKGIEEGEIEDDWEEIVVVKKENKKI